MTALQDWLSNSLVTPDSIKAVIRDAWRGLTMDDTCDDPDLADLDDLADEPQLMGRGLERC
ncbi:hypothetical protein FK535_10935 [Mycolicibacterium sp. 018/SC-01/001]|uniref:hypothetical protein n=1 Tax=Mycolicibacterium sp. 018/SC-01/001 TaxID=2592069 RepID=UPI00117F0103|nr:hypothetical protein [Mycolicibacterium sp. 018/SC-01/001]TRW83181.1 hypothetical protein FK535_10935 [Mycolicibacterium sp. 018/SC-01/001]